MLCGKFCNSFSSFTGHQPIQSSNSSPMLCILIVRLVAVIFFHVASQKWIFALFAWLLVPLIIIISGHCAFFQYILFWYYHSFKKQLFCPPLNVHIFCMRIIAIKIIFIFFFMSYSRRHTVSVLVSATILEVTKCRESQSQQKACC